MKKILIGALIVGLMAGVSLALAKTETDSPVAGSVVLYGRTEAGVLVPIKVETDGSIYLK